MKPMTFGILVVVTLAAIGGAYYATQERKEITAGSFEKRPLYPDLLSRVNEVTELRVASQADGSLTMRREGDGWVLAEKHNYPADFDKISQNLVAVASMEILEPKTKRPENHADLFVEDVEAPEGTITRSVRVTARAGADTVADLVVGKSRPVDVGGGVFVRKKDQDQVWLVDGSYQPNTKALQWLDRNIVNVDSRRIVRVELKHADGATAEAAKPDIASEDMAYASPVPEGKKPKPAHEMNNLANIPDFLILDDVRPAEEMDWDGPTTLGRYTTYDGMTIVMTAVEEGDNTWFRLRAEPSARDPRLDAFVEEHQGQDSPQGRMADEMKPAETVAEEIAALNERLAPWAYRFTAYKTDKATSRPGDLLQDASIGQ